MKYYEIIKGTLYQRGNTRRLRASQKQALLDLTHVDTVVGVCSEGDPQWAVMFPEVRYEFHKMPDGELGDELKEKFLGLATALAADIINGKRVLVYCNGGRNRSSLLSALILRKLKRVPNGPAALAYMRQARPNAFGNPAFAKWLEELS